MKLPWSKKAPEPSPPPSVETRVQSALEQAVHNHDLLVIELERVLREREETTR